VILAVIPARGGSKRIPRKNIKIFKKIPIIAWSIRAAIESNCFDRIIVSTDDTEIAAIATEYGADVPFTRPQYLSDDNTETIKVVQHAIKWIVDNDQSVSSVCCIYPTAPLIQAKDLKEGKKILDENDVDYVFTAGQYQYPIQRALHYKKDKKVKMYQPKYLHTRTQDLELSFHDAGQFYWGKADAWLSGKSAFDDKSIPLFLNQIQCVDINTYDDWKIAEFAFDYLVNLKNKNLPK
jgi:pseudaminic acid cytidylyltransferase